MLINKKDIDILNKNIIIPNTVDTETSDNWNIEFHLTDTEGNVIFSIYDLDISLWEIKTITPSSEILNEVEINEESETR